jgi:hypothetical protein
MAVHILSNKSRDTSGTVVVHVATANASLVVAGNSSVSNIALPGETVTGATIRQVFYGIDGGAEGECFIYRAGDLVGTYNRAGHHNYAGHGISLSINPAANLDVSFQSASNSMIIIELQKILAPK